MDSVWVSLLHLREKLKNRDFGQWRGN
jgi:hypothetical protein